MGQFWDPPQTISQNREASGRKLSKINPKKKMFWKTCQPDQSELYVNMDRFYHTNNSLSFKDNYYEEAIPYTCLRHLSTMHAVLLIYYYNSFSTMAKLCHIHIQIAGIFILLCGKKKWPIYCIYWLTYYSKTLISWITLWKWVRKRQKST
jgi:hypothetical protein